MIEQLSVFLENQPGRLAHMCRTLGDAGHNMHVLVVADTSEYGVARVVVDRPKAARDLLEAAGYAVSITPVLAVKVPDEPGGLANVLELMERERINVEYMYCYVRPSEPVAVDIFRVEKPESAAEVLQTAGIETVSASEVYEPDA
jgi:hypothetical protein